MIKKIIIVSAVAVALLSGAAIAYAAGAFGLQDTAAGAGYETAGAPTISQTVGQIVQVVLGFIGLLFFGLTLYGGITWLIARGKEEKITEAKNILEAAVIGIIIVAASYAIATFVISRIGAGAESGSCSYVVDGESFCEPNISQELCDNFSGTWTKGGSCGSAEKSCQCPDSSCTAMAPGDLDAFCTDAGCTVVNGACP